MGTMRTWHRRQAIKVKQQRVLSGLKWVEASDAPAFSKVPRKLTGSPAKGKAYENAVNAMVSCLFKQLPHEGSLWLGPWFRFEDDNGLGLAQPDALLVLDSHAVVIEAKLKQTRAAIPQVQLYNSLTAALFMKPCVGVQVFKYPSEACDDMSLASLKSLFAFKNQDVVEKAGSIYNLHWLG